ncbi:hypothetical protein ACPFUL_000116 [Vibrio cholerae]
MKRLMLSTLLITTPFFTFAADDVFTSERWKAVKVKDPHFDQLAKICNEKYPGSRPANIFDAIEFKNKFEENESQRPRLYSFLRETSGFADITDPKVQSAFKLDGEHRMLSLPFVFDDLGGFSNSGIIFNIGKKKVDDYPYDDAPVEDKEFTVVFGAHLETLEFNGTTQIDLAPSLGEPRAFCIVETENS